MRFLISLLVNGAMVYFASWLFSGVYAQDYFTAILVALLLTLINLTVKPVITILTLPITVLTLGLFLLIINGGMVLLVDWLVPGFDVDGWLWAIIFSVFLALMNLLFGNYQVEIE